MPTTACIGPSPGSSQTGRRAGEPLWGEGKARAVRALADEQGLDLERSFAYSNGDEDVPFLETVGNPVAVSPERELRAGAQRGGWPVLRCEGRPATPGRSSSRARPRSTAGCSRAWEPGWVSASCVTSRRERVDIGDEVGADLAPALAGIDVRVVSGAEHLWSARPCGFVSNHQNKLNPILIMKLLRGGFTGVAKKEAERWVPETRFGRDLGFRWALYMKNGPGSRFPFARLDRDPSGQADQAMKEVDPAMQPTRLVVLASGMGSRLRSKASPKPLVELGGISLVERALAGARQAGFDEVVVVTGDRADQIDRHVLEVSRRRGIAVTVVRNERYREGNGLSALAARDGVGYEPFALVMADHVFSPSLLQQLKQASVEPGEVLVAVDTRLGRAAGVDPGDAMKVRIADGGIRAIGKQLAVYDAFEVGAFVCGPALFDAVEMAVAAGDSSLAGAIQVLADAGVARALTIGDEEWWFDVDTPRDHRNGSRHVLRGTGKPLDGAIAARLNRTLSQRVVTPALLALFPRITPNQVTLIAFAVAVAAAAGFSVGAPIAAAAARRAGQRARRQRWRGRPAHLSVVPVRRVPRRRARPGGRRHSVHRRGDLPRHRHPPGRPARRRTGASRPVGERGRPGRPPARELHDGESGDRPRPPLPRHLARRRPGP